jgi:hypothetical protein
MIFLAARNSFKRRSYEFYQKLRWKVRNSRLQKKAKESKRMQKKAKE